MGVHFVPGGHSGLYRMWAGASGEIVLACDRSGCVNEATMAVAELGFADPAELYGRTLASLARGRWATRIAAALEAAGTRGEASDWQDVALVGTDGQRRWYELRVEPILYTPGIALGAICILRSIAERRRLEQAAFAAALTDPLTGFTNRCACVAMLDHLAEAQAIGCLVLLDLDHFRAFNLRHGHAAGDRLLVAFAGLLRQLTNPEQILSRVDGETFAVILPGLDLAAGAAFAEDIRATLLRLAENAVPGELPFTASFGLASLGGSSDQALREAELALAEAKARGRNRVAQCGRRWRLGWARPRR